MATYQFIWRDACSNSIALRFVHQRRVTLVLDLAKFHQLAGDIEILAAPTHTDRTLDQEVVACQSPTGTPAEFHACHFTHFLPIIGLTRESLNYTIILV
jgi:hypothetical protein